MQQVVTIHFFRFRASVQKWWALRMMQAAHATLQDTPGLEFYRLMGTGSGDGFGWRPDLETYALLGVWTKKADAQTFTTSHPTFWDFYNRTDEHLGFWLSPLRSHGAWSGRQPFRCQTADEALPLAVLTRASIRWQQLPSFWRHVPRVSRRIFDGEGPLFSKGVGEWPLVQQATFSLWPDAEAMKQHIYRNPAHREVMRLAREKHWYREEMFTRFRVLQLEGHGSQFDTLRSYLASATTV